MTLTALVLCPLYLRWDAIVLFLVTTAVTLCLGHSLGMHRRLIHGAYQCPLWLEHLFVYLGVLVGMAGPLGMVRIHDHRDWAQRQPDCHPFFCHRQGFWTDAWQQLHCRLHLAHPPEFQLEARLAGDRIYAFMERTWMVQQVPWAIGFWLIGGPAWVVWGVCARVAVSVTGHWLIGYFAHRQGGQHWVVEGAGVQGYDVGLAGLISMGESWHNNHHAFPGSARLGLYSGQVDPGWEVLKALEAAGLVWNIVTPDDLPARPALRAVAPARWRPARPALTRPSPASPP
jgi:stearoyl-CoA desaturase (delta-9 desaturase)